MSDDRDRIAWQVRAATLQVDLLREQLTSGTLLPVLRWTTQPSGCVLVGEPPATDDNASRQAAVRAWADRLGLPVQSTPIREGHRLTAHGTYRQVHVTVSTVVDGEEH